jgi:hypothetical protein
MSVDRGAENRLAASIGFKPSGFTWRLGKCDQIKIGYKSLNRRSAAMLPSP